ncbi:GATA-type zinc finger protein 1 [Halichoeres trimaculatus]|uniref:GATA-type zinc finger protein 1 n=1 Tax=Halichoeres trimaculatus TaxID=147232 RepID=UPI003D9E6A8A
MSTGSRTHATFIQGNQSTADQDAPHSALLYLFQEVSRLASPINDRGAPFMGKEDGAIQSFSISNSSCQHSLSCLTNYNQIEKVKQESHSNKDTPLVNLHPQRSSPWKVLSLINLQCERLLNPGDVEVSSWSPASSVAKLGNSSDNALTKAEQGSNILCEMHKIPAVVNPGTDVSETAENTYRSELVEDEVPASPLPQPRYTEEEKHTESNSFSPTGNIFNTLDTGYTSPAKLSFNTKEETREILPKPALTLDHNANITFTPEPQSDEQMPPLSFVLCFNPPSEVKSLSFAQPEPSSGSQETNLLNSTKPDLESRPVHQEEAAFLSAQTWRTKTPRKQRYPSKSVDIKDPDFQGVTFRMDTELDDSKEQCRLLITSKYSKELRKSVRKPRLRTRTALKSISSEEESDSGTSASKGKVCASCCTRKTPMWRDAEDGTPLCNACGIRFKKYRVRCVSCWHIPKKESNSNSCCLKCGNSLKLTSAHRKHSA